MLLKNKQAFSEVKFFHILVYFGFKFWYMKSRTMGIIKFI